MKTMQSKTLLTNDIQNTLNLFRLLSFTDSSKLLEALSKARYCISVIDDELSHTLRDNSLNRGKIGNFTANLIVTLEQELSEPSANDNDIKQIIEPLLQIAKQLYTTLYFSDHLISNGFHNLIKQTLTIHNECVKQITLILLCRQVEGKNE